LFVDLLSRFEVTRFHLTAGRRMFREILGFSRQIFQGALKKLQVGFQA